MRLLAWLGLSVPPLVAAACTLLAPRPAQACGGTFCDAGPNAMPVDQTGENVLFVLDGPTVEAHIQIQYDPDTNAENFAWVIPVAGIPELSIGSDPLFQALLAGSVPRYGLTQVNACQDDNSGGSPPSGFITMSDGGGAAFRPDPEILVHEVVGALEVTVLAGGTAEEVIAWLDQNGYQQDEAAYPILADYVQQGWMFAAIKLAHAEGLDQIHPLVMRYEGSEACVPLKLTRIAAAEDMAVRTFFLADDRIAPTNYDHVLVNPLKLDWLNNADNYKEVVTLAVDEAGADGKAWVTEYAATSTVISGGFYQPEWDATVFETIEPAEVVDQLTAWNLGVCGGLFTGGCGLSHPLVLPLLREYLPAPPGVDEADFYVCVQCFAEQIDQSAWDGPAFAAKFSERIVDPAFRAWEQLTTWPYLTRMYTTISPGEMTVDPIFHPHPNLPEVDNTNQIATESNFCDGSSAVALPDGRQVYLPAGAPWPDFTDQMPWVEDAEELPAADMPPIPTLDNTEVIDALLAEYNQAQGWPPQPDAGTGGDSTGGGDTDGALDGGEWTSGTGDTSPAAGDGDGGCSCTTAPRHHALTWAWVGLLGLGLARRRRS